MRPRRSTQSQPLRIEAPQYGSFGTCRTVQSRLWFVNNPRLEQQILGHLTRYREKYRIKLYAFVFQGNHYHPLTQFPYRNRTPFYRDLNARAAESVRLHVKDFQGGPLLARRYSEQALPRQEDIEGEFFYCALQPVHANLTENPFDYPAYNSFLDAINGVEREFKVIDWGKYNAAKRYNRNVSLEDYTTVYKLKYDRLPGYEHLSQEEYKRLMLKKLRTRLVNLLEEKRSQGVKFANKEALKHQKPGSLPKNTKKSTRYSYRPLVLCSCPDAKKEFLEWYFSVYAVYKEASKRYLAGEENVVFPEGTYKPPGPLVLQ